MDTIWDRQRVRYEKSAGTSMHWLSETVLAWKINPVRPQINIISCRQVTLFLSFKLTCPALLMTYPSSLQDWQVYPPAMTRHLNNTRPHQLIRFTR